jgi:hypothetical protein
MDGKVFTNGEKAQGRDLFGDTNDMEILRKICQEGQ